MSALRKTLALPSVAVAVEVTTRSREIRRTIETEAEAARLRSMRIARENDADAVDAAVSVRWITPCAYARVAVAVEDAARAMATILKYVAVPVDDAERVSLISRETPGVAVLDTDRTRRTCLTCDAAPVAAAASVRT